MISKQGDCPKVGKYFQTDQVILKLKQTAREGITQKSCPTQDSVLPLAQQPGESNQSQKMAEQEEN